MAQVEYLFSKQGDGRRHGEVVDEINKSKAEPKLIRSTKNKGQNFIYIKNRRFVDPEEIKEKMEFSNINDQEILPMVWEKNYGIWQDSCRMRINDQTKDNSLVATQELRRAEEREE